MTLLALAASVPGGGIAARAGAEPELDEPPVRFPVVFFPPTPPVYGAAIDNQPAGTSRLFGGRRLIAPDGMADFVGEMIFPPLSTRLFSLALSPALEAKIEQYRARRNALVNALLDQCVALHDAPPEVRERELQALAARQTPQIVALEAEADRLRQELIRGRLLQSSVDWSAQRKWKLATIPPGRSGANQEAEFQIVRAAAYYQDHLTPAQRGLLRELATELEVIALRARGEPVVNPESDAMFFSPETARLRLPPDLPPAVLARIAAYNTRKAALKQELRATIHEQENASVAQRNAAFARLADDQWPHLGALDTLADEIRAELGRRFEPAPPRRAPAIPSWLVAEIQAYNEERDSYFGELRYAIQAAVDLVPRPSRSGTADEQIQREKDFLAQQEAARRQATLEFQVAHAARFAELARKYQGVRGALETIARTASDEKTGRRLDVDTLLRQHGATLAEFDGFGRAVAIYANYRLAMLQAGLSPEQRRLLFAYAVVGLAQPIPYGELLPPRAARLPLPR